MNSELCAKALEKIGNPNIFVNVVSRRVRQLNAAGGTGSRPLIEGAELLGAADIAMREILEEKLSYEILIEEGVPGTGSRRAKTKAV